MKFQVREESLIDTQINLVPDEIYIDFKLGLLIKHSISLLQKIKSLSNSPRRDKVAMELGAITESLVEIASGPVRHQPNTNCEHITTWWELPGTQTSIQTDV